MTGAATLLTAIAGVIVALAGAWKIAKDARAAAESSAVAFNRALLERVKELEGRLDRIDRERQAERAALSTAIAYCQRLLWAWPVSSPVPPPVPSSLSTLITRPDTEE